MIILLRRKRIVKYNSDICKLIECEHRQSRMHEAIRLLHNIPRGILNDGVFDGKIQVIGLDF